MYNGLPFNVKRTCHGKSPLVACFPPRILLLQVAHADDLPQSGNNVIQYQMVGFGKRNVCPVFLWTSQNNTAPKTLDVLPQFEVSLVRLSSFLTRSHVPRIWLRFDLFNVSSALAVVQLHLKWFLQRSLSMKWTLNWWRDSMNVDVDEC